MNDLPTVSFKITGTNLLLMHSERGVNVLDPLVKKKKAITAKRKKTDEDLNDIAYLEWEIGLYWNEKIGPFIPGHNIQGCITEAAKLEKRGQDIARGLTVLEDEIILEYKGPRDKSKMWNSKEFKDIRAVRQQKVRIMRCRPAFRKWSAKFTVAYDSEIFDSEDIIRIVEKAGKYCGLGDFRQRFGRFSSEVIK